jgi:hypothetical protein
VQRGFDFFNSRPSPGSVGATSTPPRRALKPKPVVVNEGLPNDTHPGPKLTVPRKFPPYRTSPFNRDRSSCADFWADSKSSFKV